MTSAGPMVKLRNGACAPLGTLMMVRRARWRRVTLVDLRQLGAQVWRKGRWQRP